MDTKGATELWFTGGNSILTCIVSNHPPPRKGKAVIY